MLRILALIFTSLILVASSPLHAQTQADDSAYPTLTALIQANVPAADPVELAQRLRGVQVTVAPPANPPTLQVGDQHTFHVTNPAANYSFQVQATLRTIGDHLYIWVEAGVNIPASQLEALVTAFDEHIYDAARDLWGSEASPGIDGDPRLHTLFTTGIGSGTAAYFARRHTFPDEVFPNSSEREMFYVNLDAFGMNIAHVAMESTIAHEFQHMIRANIDVNEATWLNEAFSTFTELYLGYDLPRGLANAYIAAPGTQLNSFGLSGTNRASDYGAGFTFVTYFYERYGIDALRALSMDPTDGLISVDNVLRKMGEPGVNEFFAGWVLANLIQDSTIDDGRYGYEQFTLASRPPMQIHTGSGPHHAAGNISQYATVYHALTDLGDSAELDIAFTLPVTVQLFPTEPPDGRYVWYSNRGDVSDMTLTRAFDLTGVEKATLNYRAWYEIEEGWDYGYLMVSADGKHWDILATQHTTSDDPQGNAYGPGYSGASNGWVEESVALNDYVGQQIQVRFEVITDDAVNQPGLVIDNVSIPEIDYTAGFETGDGGWEAAGWIRTDNLLPQSAWVQAVQFIDGDVVITRWQASGGESHWSLSLQAGVDQVVIAISPFAPVTTVPTAYTLDVTGR